jgi:predicted nucleic acid-binding protein
LISAIDTCIVSAIWTRQPNFLEAKSLLETALDEGALVVSGIVYAELLAHPTVEPATADAFFRKTMIEVDYAMDRAVWHEAGIRYRAYSERRRKAKHTTPRRLLADFVIGAHALLRADRLITFNRADFRRDFPQLRIAPEKSK